MKFRKLHLVPKGVSGGVLTVEMLSVTIAVVLGFMVNEWREGIHESRQADTALLSIKEELQRNRDGLSDRMPYYEQVATILDSLVTVDGAAPVSGSSIPGWQGFRPPVLSEASYEAASATGALSHMDFAVVSEVAMAYLAQDLVRNTFDWTLQAYVSGQLETWVDARRVFHLFHEVSQAGVETYDLVLADLSARVPEEKAQ